MRGRRVEHASDNSDTWSMATTDAVGVSIGEREFEKRETRAHGPVLYRLR